MLKKAATDFCASTYIHGFKFLILPKRKLFETLFWVIVTITSIVVASTLGWMYLSKTKTCPTWTLSDSPNYAIWNYPFPTVTVCNFNIISKARAFEMANKMKRPNDISLDQMFNLLGHTAYLLEPTISKVSHQTFIQIQEILDDNGIEVEELLSYLAPTCKEMIQRCTWKGQQISCENMFQQIKTPVGFCCSFNFFGLKNHTFSKIKYINSKVPKQPRRVAATGYLTALEMVINSVPEDYFASTLASVGHRVFIHYPYTIPDDNSQSIIQSTEGLIFISIKPTSYLPDSRLNSLSVSQRNCLFRTEKELQYFQYTYDNCLAECRANITVELCGCIPFYYFYPGNEGNDSYKIRVCTLRDITCLSQNHDKIYSSTPNQKDNVKQGLTEWSSHETQCGACLPDCETCYYFLEASNGVLIKEYSKTKPTLYGKVDLVNQSVFRIFFDDLVAKKYTTFVRYYWHTLLGFLGGLLGFIIGFSIVSIIEVVYFFTFQPLINYLAQNHNSKIIKDKKLDKSYNFLH